jgi:hypothetical protein
MAKIGDVKFGHQWEEIYFEEDGGVVMLAGWGQKIIEQEMNKCIPQKKIEHFPFSHGPLVCGCSI